MFGKTKSLFLIVASMLCMASCDSIREDLPRCELWLEFVFDYNMEYADAFNPQVKSVDVLVFDSDDKLLFTKSAEVAALVGGNRMVDYSGRGPTAACICKPDLVAPGCSVVSCAGRADKYTIKSGTSMSTPIVSGATALLLERYPDMTNKDVKLKLRESCTDIGLPRNQQGWGLLDVEKLVSK